MTNKAFNTQSELFDYLRQNKNLLIMEKKSAVKHADGVGCFYVEKRGEEITVKQEINPDILNKDVLKVRVIVNTSSLMDSHMDVHIPGLWAKTLKESRQLYLLKQHQQNFEGVISDTVSAWTETMAWNALGYSYAGTTQALVFDAEIEKNRSKDVEFMAEQYAKNRVKNHSVGMQYVKISLAMNSENKYDKEEKETWDKYIQYVANREMADEYGYFWAVTEAKLYEGSAVLFGSNPITPTLYVKAEPSNDTQEPLKSTQKNDTGWEMFN